VNALFLLTDEMQWYECDKDALGEQPPPSVGHHLAAVGKTLLYSVGGDADLYLLDISTASSPWAERGEDPSLGSSALHSIPWCRVVRAPSDHRDGSHHCAFRQRCGRRFHNDVDQPAIALSYRGEPTGQ